MQPRDHASLLDIAKQVHAIQGYLAGVTRETFLNDTMRQDAVIRRFEIMGEAANRLSPALRDAHPEVPWRLMRDMRHFISHAYDKVDAETIWDTAGTDIAPLLEAVERILNE
jgi:uncharacterized protein with HEPN domain